MHNIAMHMHVYILVYVFVLVSMHIVCTMHSSLCMHSTVSCITCMHFQCFKEKHCTLIVSLQNFPKKLGGGPNALLPPPHPFWGGMVPLAPPPVADPMVQEVEINELTLGRSNSQKPSSLVFSSGNRHVVNNAY